MLEVCQHVSHLKKLLRKRNLVAIYLVNCGAYRGGKKKPSVSNLFPPVWIRLWPHLLGWEGGVWSDSEVCPYLLPDVCLTGDLGWKQRHEEVEIPFLVSCTPSMGSVTGSILHQAGFATRSSIELCSIVHWALQLFKDLPDSSPMSLWFLEVCLFVPLPGWLTSPMALGLSALLSMYKPLRDGSWLWGLLWEWPFLILSFMQKLPQEVQCLGPCS